MKDVAGKVAFITGGSSGIGLGIAQACVHSGMKVAIGFRRQEHANQAMAQLAGAGNDVHAIHVDVANRANMENAANEVIRVFGRVHVLVNNAGVQNPVSLSDMSYEEWDRLMAVNVGGVFNGIRAFLPHIKQHGEGGHVVTTASVLGLCSVSATGGYGAYCASKFAVVGMMEALRAELTQSNIGVSILCPGVVRSNLEPTLKDVDYASDPMEIGPQVLRGIRRNDLYILTHPEFSELFQLRNDVIIASTPTDVQPTDARRALIQRLVQSSIFLPERAKHSC